MLDLNKEYTYKEICEILGWTAQTGNNRTKKNQIEAIENAYIFIHPTNKKTKKPKKSYVFLEQIKEIELVDGRRNNGAKSLFPETEFNYLLACIVYTGKQMNHYFERDVVTVRGEADEKASENAKKVYVSNSLIYKEFGFDVYSTLNAIEWNNDENLIHQLFVNICIDVVKSQTVTKICKRFGYEKNSLPKGILRQQGSKGKAATKLVSDDELLPKYNEFMQMYLEEFKCKTERDAIERGLYLNIIKKIEAKFEEEKLYGVKRYSVICFDEDMEFEYKHSKKTEFQNHFQEIVLEQIETAVKNRIEGTKKYKLELKDWQKKLLKNYLDQLLGNEVEAVEIPDEDEEWLALL